MGVSQTHPLRHAMSAELRVASVVPTFHSYYPLTRAYKMRFSVIPRGLKLEGRTHVAYMSFHEGRLLASRLEVRGSRPLESHTRDQTNVH